ncbi:MAG: M2 family metallopeptidase [Gemmatimonadaceae bacterium]
MFKHRRPGRIVLVLATGATAVAGAACSARRVSEAPAPVTMAPQGPTAADAEQFMRDAESRLAQLAITTSRAAWVAANFITDDTEILSADAQREYSVTVQQLALAADRFDDIELPPPLRRKLVLLRLSLAAPPPSDSAKAAELTRITVGMEADYGRGSYCPESMTTAATDSASRGNTGNNGESRCLGISELGRIMAESRDPAVLLDVWEGWHRISPDMRAPYARFVELSNEGARELGFADLGAMWRSNYDMPPDQFALEVERLWQQVRPLYLSLHAYVRRRLGEHYGTELVPENGMIPAHLLGNMWAQEWGNIYPLVAPPARAPAYDLTALLREEGLDARGMAGYAERFFTSLGFDPLPETFWSRSLFVKPRDRDVVCHASAWNIDSENDVRIKMCIDITAEDFVTVHHELGHNFYQRAYNDQPFFFQDGAHDGFHEAIGDAIALSMTPGYLREAGLLETVPPPAGDTALLLRQALDKIAFLPFGLLIDQWRWKIFSGEITPDEYNSSWWEMRNRYQGVSAPLPRSGDAFDPGAKYHVPANTPYTRYFLARVLQFQFYGALCREAGHTGPLYRCSFFGSEEAGAKLAAMLREGRSEPWPDVLYRLTGERTMDANAIAEYFEPLQEWLDVQNRGVAVGW